MISICETKDHELIGGLYEEVQNLHHHLHPELFKPFNKAGITAVLRGYLTNDDCRAYVALVNGEQAGCIVLFVREKKESAFSYPVRSIYIDQISVLEKYRRSGVAKLLLQMAETLADELSIKRIELDHWSANTIAASYFRKRGYSIYREMLFKTM